MTQSDYLDMLYDSAKCALEVDGQEAVAVELLQAYVPHRLGHVHAIFLLGDALRVLGQSFHAQKYLLNALKLAPETKQFTIKARLGMLCASLGNRSQAESWFTEAVADSNGSTCGWIWIMRGQNLSLACDFLPAELCYSKAIEIGDDDAHEAWCGLGNIYRAQRRYEDARRAYTRAIELVPEYEEANEAFRGLENISDALLRAANIPDDDNTFGASDAGAESSGPNELNAPGGNFG